MQTEVIARATEGPIGEDAGQPSVETGRKRWGFQHAFDRGFLLAGLFSVFAIGPLLYPGFYYNHRGLFAAYEIVGIAVNPSPGWLPSLATGLASLTQGAPPYWIARLLLLAGIAPTGAIKTTFAISIIAAVCGTYLLARRYLRETDGPDDDSPGVSWPALVAAALVASVPYLAGVVLIRGDLAEAWALGLLPWALWTGLATTRTNADGGREVDVPVVVVGAVLWGIIGLTHVGLLLAGMLLLLALRPGRENWAGPLAGTILTMAGWTLMVSRQRIGLEMPPITPADLSQIFATGGNDGFAPRTGMLISLGPVAALFFFLGVAPMGVRRPWGPLIFSALAILFSLAWTTPYWQPIPAIITQPYQLLGPVAIALALAGAAVVRRYGLGRPVAAMSIAVLALVAGYGNYSVQPVQAREPIFLNPSVIDRTIVLLESSLQGGEPRPGGFINVVLVWQTRQPIPRDWTVFVQLVNESGQVVAQHDGPPVNSIRPTKGWRVGESIVDAHQILIKPDQAPGRYRIAVGLYDLPTGNRADVQRGSQITDQIIIAELELR